MPTKDNRASGRLLGAGIVFLENAGATRQQTNQVCEQHTLQILRRNLTELRVQALLAEGRNMPFEVAVDDALNESPSASVSGPGGSSSLRSRLAG